MDEPVLPQGQAVWDLRLALLIPDGWLVKESVTVLAPDGQANAIFASEPLGTATDSLTYAQHQGDLLRREFPGFTELSFGPVAVGLPGAGYLRHFQWTPPDGVPITQLQLYATHAGRSYTATATTPATTAARFEPDFRAILGAWRVRAQPDAVPGAPWIGSLAVSVPTGWLVKESVTVMAPDGRANVIFSSEPLDPALDTQTYAAIQGELLGREFPWYRQFSFGQIGAQLPNAHLRHFDWTPPDGVSVTQLQLYSTNPGRGYTATATATSAEFAMFDQTFRAILESCSAPAGSQPQPPPPAVPALTPEQAQAKLRQLRRAGATSWQPPERAAVAALLDDIAQAVRPLDPSPALADTLARAAGLADDAGALHQAGTALLSVGLGDLAVAPLARCFALAPTAGTAIALSRALESAGALSGAAALYRENPWVTAQSEPARGLYSHFAAMVGDWQATYDMASQIDPAGTSGQWRDRAARRLGRVNALHGVAGLGSDDVRGWSAVLAGSLLLCRTPAEHVGMNGRFAAKWEQAEDVVARIEVLRAVLTRANRMPDRIVAGPDRDSQVLGWTIAHRFGLPAPVPAETPPHGGTNLAVVFDWSGIDDSFRDRVGPDPGTVLFGYTLNWTTHHALAPDIAAIQAQATFAPWHERMRLDGPPEAMADPDPEHRPRVVNIPADHRQPEQIAADLAQIPAAPPGGQDFDELLQVTAALGSRPTDVGMFGGGRDEYFPGDPVPSASFA